MFWRKNKKGCAKQCVGSRSEYVNVACGGRKGDTGTGASTDPVALHQFDRFWPIKSIKIIEESVGVCGDPHHPLAHVALEHWIVPNIAAPIGGDFFVRQDRSQTGAPIHGCIGEVGETV